MHSFTAYARLRDALRLEGLYDDWVPFGIERPSGKIQSCKQFTRRLISRFKPKMVKQVATAVQRPRHAPMRWGPVR